MSNVSLSHELMNQALEALEYENSWHEILKVRPYASTVDAITALRAALAQDPVAWLAPRTVDSYSRPDLGYETCSKTDYGAFAVYTAPPQRKPLPLKDVERLIYENTKINANVADDKELLGYIVNAIRAVERAHNIVE